MQLKDSRETLMYRQKSITETRAAQLVVCNYVNAWYPDLDDAGRVAEVNELLDILGLKGH